MDRLEKLATDFLRGLQVAAYSKHTLRGYEGSLRKFREWGSERAKPVTRPRQIDHELLGAYIAHLRRQELKSSSIEKIVSGVREFRRWLTIHGHAPELHNMPRVGGKESRLPVVLSRTEVEALIQTAAADTPHDGSEATHVGVRDRAILEVLYSTGCRNAELCGMNKGDVDLRGGLIRVVNGKGRKDRLVPLGVPARRALKRYLEYRYRPTALPGHGQAVFLSRDGYRVGTKTVHRIVAGAGESAGFKKAIGPHVLRHSFATHLLRAGAPLPQVSKLMGHASVATTMVYVHLAANDILDAFDKHHPRAGDSNHRESMD